MSGYVQYFVQDPFIVHMYSYKQIELLKFFNRKGIILNLDATGSLISKPHLVLRKYYIMLLQYNTLSIPPVLSL